MTTRIFGDSLQGSVAFQPASRAAQHIVDRSVDGLFLNLIGSAKVECDRRARSTPPFDIVIE